MATHIWGNGMEFENPLVVTLDNKVVYETVIGGEEDMKLYDQVQNGALDSVNARLKNISFTATAGPHKVGVTFRRRTFAESDDQLQMFAPGGGQDRLYRVALVPGPRAVQRQGRQRHAEPRPHLQLLPGDGATADGAGDVRADRSSSSLARRAYRRPVTADDVDRAARVLRATARSSGGFEGGMRSAITGILASPFFLYRGERVPAGVAPGDTYAISDLELASKLSFFLWNTIPDDELLRLAVAGRLNAARGARSAGRAHAGRPAVDHAGRATSCRSGST